MSLSIFTEWFYTNWEDIKGYRIEFRNVMGVKQQRHHWLLSDGSVDADKWIKAIQ